MSQNGDRTRVAREDHRENGDGWSCREWGVGQEGPMGDMGTWTQGCGDMRDVGVQGPVEAMGTCGRCRDTEGWRLGM